MSAIVEQTDAPMVRWVAAHVDLLDGGEPVPAFDHAADAAAHGCGTIAVQILEDVRRIAVDRRNAHLAATAIQLLAEQRMRNTGWPEAKVGGDPMATLGLSKREGEVATAAASGMTDHEIASALYISVRTVNAHLRSTYRKLGVSGRRELRGVLADARHRCTVTMHGDPGGSARWWPSHDRYPLPMRRRTRSRRSTP